MTWQPSKQQLEDAAIAGDIELSHWTDEPVMAWNTWDGKTYTPWQPHLPTTQGKADLLDLMLALPVGIYWLEDVTMAVVEHRSPNGVVYTKRTNIQKLAQAVIEVAALVGAKMRGEV